MWSGAEAYDQLMGRWSRQLAPALIDFACVKNGDRVIDIGCGTGSLSRALLDHGSTIQVVGVDSAAPFVEYCSKKLDRNRAVLRQADAHDLPFADASFDHCLSLFVVNFIPDALRGVREMLRITRPQGIVAAAVWDYGGAMEMLRTLWDAAAELDAAAEPLHERHMPYCRQGELSDLWVQGGFVDVDEMALDADVTFGTFEDYWAPFLAGIGPSGSYVAGLSADRQNMLRDRLSSELAPNGEHLPITLKARAWAVRGSVPVD